MSRAQTSGVFAGAVSRRLTGRGVSVAVTLLGAILFARSMTTSGWCVVAAALSRVGVAGGLLVLAISTVRPMARALAWARSDETDALSFTRALGAGLTGEALGTLSPLGPLVSESAKVALVGRTGAFVDAAASTAIENMFYALSVAAVLVAGATTVLIGATSAEVTREAAAGLAVIGAAAVAALVWGVTAPSGWASRLAERRARGKASARVLTALRGIGAVEARVQGFARRHPRRVLAILCLELAFHVAAVAEVYLTLTLLTGSAPPLLTAFALEAVNRATTVLFKFVPLRLGIDEVTSSTVAASLQFSASAGVALAVVRRARIVAWTAVGLGLQAHRSLWAPRSQARAGAGAGHP